MPTSIVNLDALIKRQDFQAAEDVPQSDQIDKIGISHLRKGEFFYNALRKPDFQRETANWTPSKIADFINTFLNQDLIPAVIMWQSPTVSFVIDGAHRLSALMAWVHDDYGDGELSREFFGQQQIPPEQLRAATRTRGLVDESIGSYSIHKKAAENPQGATQEVLQRALKLGTAALHVQWIKGDANKAEQSFIKINQRAVPIDPVELRIIQGRKKPNAIAARAIVHAGTGHKYWKQFAADVQAQIEGLSKDIYDIFFVPPLDVPVKTLDLPFAGRGYSAQTLPLMFAFVNMMNGIESDKAERALAPDLDGQTTLQFLKNSRKIARRMSSMDMSSLGLHPAVYTYGSNARFQPTAFLALASMFLSFENKDLFKPFTQCRAAFEEFLIRHKGLANQIATTIGSGVKGFARLQSLYEIAINSLQSSTTDDETVLANIKATDDLAFLSTDEKALNKYGKEFSTPTKSAKYLTDALDSALRCALCGARMHKNSMTLDHIKGKAQGGTGSPENAQWTHPYCNSIKT